MSSASFSIAVIGATGAVGREMLVELANSQVRNSYGSKVFVGVFASERSQGKKLPFGDNALLEVQAFDVAKLAGYDYALMSAGGDFSRAYSPKLEKMGVWVIDNSSAFRLHSHVPLVVPEVNSSVLSKCVESKSQGMGGIIANPNCSTIQLAVNLAPLESHFGVDTVITSTYQSVSGAGWKGIQALEKESRDFSVSSCGLSQNEPFKGDVFPLPIAFNVIADIGGENAYGHTVEEEKMVFETRKIFSREDLAVMATAVRVPVYYGHGQTLVCKLKRAVTRQELKAALQDAAGVELCGEKDTATHDLASPRGVQGRSVTQVSRVRLGVCDESSSARSEWVQMWNVADNLKKGAASNAVQILESLLRANH